ncbi:AraC family transcriptional regulator [Fortiea contorta]|uniref:AraC family transcriptional regulator n=1 Tax=Fortiea contorta TaxID=1892405 RepID=UPI00037371A0|nr:AraC family transcriptional regulator [Fortiea contorta]
MLLNSPDIREIYGLSAIYLQHQLLAEGVEFAHLQHPPTEESGRTEHHLIFIHTDVPQGTYHEQVTEGIFSAGELKTGDTIIIPAGVDCRANWDREHRYLLFAVAPQVFQQQLGEFDSLHEVDLRPQFFLPDSLLYNLGVALQQEVENPGLGGRLYVDSLLTTLSIHLARHYCTYKARKMTIAGLSTSTLNRVLQYIHAHLDQDLTLAELAAIAQLSPNYFAMQFKQSTNMAPHQYVLRQRIATAKTLLLNGHKIAEVAYQLGFAHQSHFNRHFKRLLGCTPKQFLAQQ